MDKKILILLFLLIIGIIVVPKEIHYENEKVFGYCMCSGIKWGDNCIGKKYGCVDIERSRSLADSKPVANDILLLLDVSPSMRGDRFINAKKAAVEIVEQTKEHDRVALITFGEKATLVQNFTNEKSQIINSFDKMAGTKSMEYTNYEKAIKKAASILGEQSQALKKIVILSDGEPSSKNLSTNPYSHAENLIGKGACIYSLGFTHDVNNENVLNNFADMSSRLSECGRFYSATAPYFNIEDTGRQILRDTSQSELTMDVHSPSTKTYEKRDVLVNLSTNIDALCSYSLNDGNEISFEKSQFRLEPDFGKNTLEIKCKREKQKDWETDEKINFYVQGSPSIFDALKDFFRRDKEYSEPSKSEVKNILEEIFEKEKLEVIRNIRPSGDGSLITVNIQNTKPVPLENVRINQIIPSHVAEDVALLDSDEKFTILDSNPIAIQFYRKELKPEEITSVEFFIQKPLTREDLKQIETEIRYDSLDEDSLEELFAHQNRTGKNFDVKRTTNPFEEGKQKITLEPQQDMQDVNVYMNIPKCMAVHINDVYFKNTDYKVISEDPLIGWNFDEVQKNISIELDAQSDIEDYCANRLSVITFAKEVEGQSKRKETQTKAEHLIPLFIIPLVIIFILIYFRLPKKNWSENNPVLRYVVIFILIVLFIWLIFPKESSTSEKSCSCFGISFAKNCYGIPHTCKSYEFSEDTADTFSSERCLSPSCQNLQKYLSTDPKQMSEAGMDVALIFDQSKSMEGNKLQRAKDASINLLGQMKTEDRISLISFDNSSTMAHDFSEDKESVKKSIQNISLGLTTKYIPALRRTYYNYLSEGNHFNKWMAILLSDGEPMDDPEDIYQTVRSMGNEGICINTIGYGDEIKEGGQAEKILQEIAKISRENTGCGSYYYSPSSISTLEELLGRLYKESEEKNPGLLIEASTNSLSLTNEEEFRVSAKIFSNINNLKIPGSFKTHDKKYCSPPANTQLIIQNGDFNETYNMHYDYKDEEYKFQSKNLPLGVFNVSVTATLTGDGCKYKNTLELGTLKISKHKGFSKCRTEECQEISKYLFERPKDLVKVLITDYAFIPQNVSIREGTTVVWKNVGEKPHTVTSGINNYDGYFHSGILEPGEEFNKTFDSYRNFNYFDNLSVNMRGGGRESSEKDLTFGNFKLEYKDPIDLALIIDNSESMYGERLLHMKKATQKLVDMTYPGDRMALLKFSGDAQILQTFTEDKELLKKMTEEIKPAGTTRYIPALEKAHELYNDRELENGKVAVFLTDGQPWDKGKPESIYNTAKKLIDDGVCLYTVGYGEEIYRGSPAEKLLEKIVELSQDSGNCGMYNYAPSHETRLVKIFGSIYHDAAGDVKGLRVIPNIRNDVIYDNQTLEIEAKVKSTFTDNYLPGVINRSSGKICGPPAQVSAVIKDKNNRTIKEAELNYRGETTGYATSFEELDEGDYKLLINARSISSDGDSCEFTGTAKKNITVLNSETLKVNPYFLAFVAVIFIFIGFLYLKKPNNYLN
ncbi:MAG: VWA domain-containing protein [Candidatus Nanoarchaeia archaeon]